MTDVSTSKKPNAPRQACLIMKSTCGFRTSKATKTVALILIVLPLSIFFMLYDDTTNPDLQDYTTHMEILDTRVQPESPRPSTCNNCNVFNFKTMIKPKNICSGDKPIDLLVMVTTIPKASDSRKAIRKTWALHTRNNTGNVRHMFLFGGGWSRKEQELLKLESAKYGDILQDDYKDAYYNLSYKMVSGYRWALRQCPHAKFILRTADDNFINMPRILDWVRTEGPKNLRVQVGHIFEGMKVYRRRDKKYYVSDNEFPEEYYPNYAVGTAFLYSMDAVREIIQVAPNIPFFAIEDAWFGLVMREIKMETKEVAGFDKLLVGMHMRQFKSGTCPLEGDFYDLHLVTAENMQKLWRVCKMARVIKSGNH